MQLLMRNVITKLRKDKTHQEFVLKIFFFDIFSKDRFFPDQSLKDKVLVGRPINPLL